MARFARVIAAGIPHHVTQRGNARRFILENDCERIVYLDLLQKNADLHGVSVLGYCLMSNHIHLVAMPLKVSSLACALKETHGRYASFWNAIKHSSGHVWQGRYYSCPLDELHLWQALRYVELNPVRAAMVDAADKWPWSSAAAHCGSGPAQSWLDDSCWTTRWSNDTWRAYLGDGETETCLQTIRQHTHTGRPLGNEEFTRNLEQQTKRQLAPKKRGPVELAGQSGNQAAFNFNA